MKNGRTMLLHVLCPPAPCWLLSFSRWTGTCVLELILISVNFSTGLTLCSFLHHFLHRNYLFNLFFFLLCCFLTFSDILYLNLHYHLVARFISRLLIKDQDGGRMHSYLLLQQQLKRVFYEQVPQGPSTA